MIKSASETRGGRVLRVHVGIGKEFEIGFLVVPHQRLEEIVDRVVAKISGDISDPKPPIWIGHIGELAAAQQRCSDIAIELPGLIDQNLVRHLGGIAEQHDQAVMRIDKHRFEANGRLITLDGLGDLALRLERTAEVTPCRSHVRSVPDGFAIVMGRFVEPASVQQCIAEIVVGLGKIRPLTQRFGQVSDGLASPADIEQQNSETVVGLDRVHAAGDDGVKLRHRSLEIASRAIHIAEAGLGLGKSRLQRQRMLEGLHRLIHFAALGRHIAKAAMERRNIPLEADGLADQLQAHLNPLRPGRELAKHVQALDMTGIGSEHCRIKSLGFVQPSGRVMVEPGPIKFRAVDAQFERGNLGRRKPARHRAFENSAGIARRTCHQQGFHERKPVLALLGVRLQRRVEIRQRGLGFALANHQGAERVIGLGIVGFGFQDAAEQPFGAVDTPGIEMGEPFADRLVVGTRVRIHSRDNGRREIVAQFLSLIRQGCPTDEKGGMRASLSSHRRRLAGARMPSHGQQSQSRNPLNKQGKC